MKANRKIDMKNRQIACVAAIFIGISLFSSARAVDEYQQKVLFSPSSSVLAAEARGRIMIYDGLRQATVTRAMDEQFDRIENMMFVGTVIEQEDGELEVEEDGCD